MATERVDTGWLRAVRAVSVLALLAVGSDHVYEYAVDHYAAIPTIGTLFLLNAIGGFGLGAALLIPLRRFAPRRHADRLRASLAGAGIGLAGGSLAGLLVSESRPLFGFMEVGYRTSIVVAIVAEITAVFALLALAAMTFRSGNAARAPSRGAAPVAALRGSPTHGPCHREGNPRRRIPIGRGRSSLR
jgi:hypothetical protein